MPGNTVRVLCPLAALLLAACVGPGLAPAPAPGASLAGNWRLDPAASDDPQKIIARMREEALQRIARHAQQPTPMARPGARRAGGASADAAEGSADGLPDSEADARSLRRDPLRNSQMMRVLAAALARGDFLTVRAGDGEFVLDYGTSVRRFTPGAHSVVSAEGGVGDQTSGWSGRDYVINVRAQMGPDVSERYALAADGKHLIEKLRIGPAELPVVNLTRVYGPSNEPAPRQPPNSD